MRLTYLETDDFRRGDVIFTRAAKKNFFVNWFCRPVGIEFPHVAVCLNSKMLIDITRQDDVRVMRISDVIDNEAFEARRPSGSTRSIRPAKLRALLRERYSAAVMVHNALKMIGLARSKAPTHRGHSCTTFARQVLNAMGIPTGAETPMDFQTAMSIPEWLDFFGEG